MDGSLLDSLFSTQPPCEDRESEKSIFDDKSIYQVLSEGWTLDLFQALDVIKSDLIDHSRTRSIRDYWHNVLASRAKPLTPPTSHALLTRNLILRMHHFLKHSSDLDNDLCTLLNSAAPEIIERLLFQNGSLPHVAYRAYVRLLGQGKVPEIELRASGPRSIDDHILENELHMRNNRARDDLDVHSCTIQTFKSLVSARQGSNEDADAELERTSIAPTELPLLDECRLPSISFRGSDRSFREAFAWATGDMFRDLDWNNVMVVGDIVSSTLLRPCCSPSRRPADTSGRKLRPRYFGNIGLRLYGLELEAANAKLQEIHDVWKRNLAPDTNRPMVLRSPDMVSFWREGEDDAQFHVTLKMASSRTDTLLDVDHDACAIGFDGTQVIMLPRCARAMETGYAVVTTRLLFSEPLFVSAGGREVKMFEYAQRGFGLRILPTYAQTLEDDTLDAELIRKSENLDYDLVTPSEGSECPPLPRTKYKTLKGFRKPDGPEPGTKTLRRIAFLGQDRMNRWLHPTPLALALEEIDNMPRLRERYPRYFDHQVRGRLDMAGRKAQLLRSISTISMALPEMATIMKEAGDEIAGFDAIFNTDQPRLSAALPLEAFVCRCERARILLESNRTARVHDKYDRLYPPYLGKWPMMYWLDGDHRSFQGSMQDHVATVNRMPFHDLIQFFVSQHTGRRASLRDYVKYLTGRVNLHHWTSDLDDDALRKDLKIPLLINRDIEDLLQPELPTGMLVPVYDSRAHDDPAHGYQGTLPRLSDSSDSTGVGNLRYLVIKRNMMWRSASTRKRDDAVDLLMLLATCSMQAASSRSLRPHSDMMCAMDEELSDLVGPALMNRRQSMFPHIPEDERWRDSVLPLREAMLFRAWAMAGTFHRSSALIKRRGGMPTSHVQFLYPVPDELFWGPEMENSEPDVKRVKLDHKDSSQARFPWWLRKEAYKDQLR